MAQFFSMCSQNLSKKPKLVLLGKASLRQKQRERNRDRKPVKPFEIWAWKWKNSLYPH